MKEYFVWTEIGDFIGADELNDVAKEGWDLICVVPKEERKTGTRFIFAREKKDGEN